MIWGLSKPSRRSPNVQEGLFELRNVRQELAKNSGLHGKSEDGCTSSDWTAGWEDMF